MAKNMTRKGLAIGSAGLLAVSLFAGAPAAQASTLTVLPNAGTSLSFVSGETYTVKVIGSIAAGANLRWEISGIDAGETVSVTGGTAADTATGVKTVTPTTVVGTPGGNTLGIAVAADETASVSVRAYLESGDAVGYNPSFDSTFSAPVEVSFIEAENVVANVALDAPIQGDVEITGSFSTNVNNEQLTATDLGVEFSYADASTLTGLANAAVTAWDKDDNFVISADVSALLKDKAIKAEIFFLSGAANNAGAIATGESLGAATLLVSERAAATIVGSTVASATANATQSLLNSAFAVKATVKDGETPAVAVANATVKVKVSTSATLSATTPVSLTINGTTYTDNAKLPGTGTVARIEVTTNADGEAFVNVSSAGLVATQTITFDFDTENISSSDLVVTQVAAEYTAYMNSAVVASSGSSVAAQVRVYNQFGGTPENKFDVVATVDAANTTIDSSVTGAKQTTAAANAALSDGVANLTLVDNGVGSTNNSYDITVQERLAGNQYGADVLAAASADDLDWKILSADKLTAGVVTTGGVQNSTTKVYETAGPIALLLEDLKSYDGERAFETAPSAYVTAFDGADVDLSGTVTTASSPTAAAAAIPSAAVTLSAPGLQFRDADGNYSADSITVYTNASGAYTAHVASNQSGKQTITITSGAATATATIVFAAAANTTVTSVVIDAPAAVEPGSTLQVKATLTDKYGNPVAATNGTGVTLLVNYDGPGFLVGAPTNWATNADGELTLTAFLGNNDGGKTSTVTVSYAPTAGKTTFDGDNDIVVQSSIVIGAVPADNTGEFSAWTKLSADQTNVKFYAKNPSGAGKIQFFFNGSEIAWHRGTSATDYEGGAPRYNTDQDAYYLVRDVDLVVGSQNVFEIYQDGTRIWRAVKTID